METIRFSKVVKYKGIVYKPNVDILVDESDVTDMLARGGCIINKGYIKKNADVIVDDDEEAKKTEFLQNVIAEKAKEKANKEPIRKKSKKA